MKILKALLVIPAVLSLSSCVSAGSQMPMMVPDPSVYETDISDTAAEPEISEPETGSSVSAEAEDTDEVPAEQPDETVAAEAAENKNSVFRYGTWFSYSPEESRYYFFYNDNGNGARMTVSKGVVSPFAYELPAEAGESGIRSGIFHFNTADNNTKAEVEMKDAENAVIRWGDGKSEKLTYISEEGIGNFNLYTDEELEKMAVKYYKTSEKDAYRLNKAECTTNEDRSVTIKIYKIVFNDQQQVLKWYIVDRHTAEGFVSEDGKTRTDQAVDIK